MNIPKDIISEFGLSKHRAALKSLMRPAVAIHAERVAQSKIGAADSRFGGLPHLPSGFVWPVWKKRPLVHMATINCADASKHDATKTLPKKGMLVFWYDGLEAPWGFDPKHRGFIEVTYVEDVKQPLELTRPPRDLISKDLEGFVGKGGKFEPSRLAFAAAPTLPTSEWISEFAPEHADLAMLDEYGDAAVELACRFDSLSCLLGHAGLIQGPWERMCQLATNGVASGGGRVSKKRVAPLEKGIPDWRSLLQINYGSLGPSWMWGDGTLFYAIKTQDLAAKAFDRSWAVYQTG